MVNKLSLESCSQESYDFSRERFNNFSAVTSGIKEIKEVMNEAEENRHIGIRTVLFIDEIHRFNRAQQDAFLPYVEKGSIILIGATTENPSFEVNAALLSRCKVFVLKSLSEENICQLLMHALTSEKGFGYQKVTMTEKQQKAIAVFANGDARTALNTLEMAVLNGEITQDGIVVTNESMEQCISRKSLLYDKSGEEHYNLISALHKSMRNSDPDAAIYWMNRMLSGGENPLYIARRLIRFASEDVGMADSNALYRACETCKADIREKIAEPVPLHLRNAATDLMAELHYGQGYQYAHDTEEKLTKMQCLPDSLKEREYYQPTEEGAEKQVKKHLEEMKQWKLKS